jgi:hypothetical protein
VEGVVCGVGFVLRVRATSSSGVGRGGGEVSVVTAGEEPEGESILAHPAFPESGREARGRGRR